MNFLWPRGIIICPTKIQKWHFTTFELCLATENITYIYNLIFTVHNLFLNYGEIIREIKIILVADWSKLKKERKWREEIETHFILGVSSASISPRVKKTEKKKLFWVRISDNKWQIKKETRKIKSKKLVSHHQLNLYTGKT